MSKTSVIRGNGIRDSTEESVKNNYAAKYAERLFENEQQAREEEDTRLSQKINDNEQAITDEATERVQADDELRGSLVEIAAALAAEISERKTSDAGFDGRITAEAAARIRADNELRGSLVEIAAALTAETAARETADNALDERVKPLEAASHTHDNKELLDTITRNRMETWDAEGGDKVLFRNAMYDAVNMFRDIYRAVGIEIYDGGYVTMTAIDRTLDGGDVTDTEINIIVDGGNITEQRKSENTAFATTEEIISEWNGEEE